MMQNREKSVQEHCNIQTNKQQQPQQQQKIESIIILSKLAEWFQCESRHYSKLMEMLKALRYDYIFNQSMLCMKKWLLHSWKVFLLRYFELLYPKSSSKWNRWSKKLKKYFV